MARAYPRRLMWTDMETTGLPEGNDYSDVHVLEVAVLVTDFGLNPLGGYQEVVAMTPEAANAIRANPYVRQMHTTSGLLADSIQAAQSGAGFTLGQVEQNVLNLLEEHGQPDEYMIAGSGVAAFDHPLIKTKMPTLATWLAYYPFDIGVLRRTVKILADTDIVSHTATSYGDQKAHRAWADVTAHLEEAGKYQEALRGAFG